MNEKQIIFICGLIFFGQMQLNASTPQAAIPLSHQQKLTPQQQAQLRAKAQAVKASPKAQQVKNTTGQHAGAVKTRVQQVRATDKTQPAHTVRQHVSSTKLQASNANSATQQPATQDQSNSKASPAKITKDFIQAAKAIPLKTQSNQAEYKKAVNEARKKYTDIYEYSTKHPLIISKQENNEMQEWRKKTDQLYSEMRADELRGNVKS